MTTPVNRSETRLSYTDDSPVGYAVEVVGQIIDRAYSHALQVDHLARMTVEAMGKLDGPERITLGESHPELLRRLLLLEHYYLMRMDQP